MREREKIKIMVVDEKTGPAFEAAVNSALDEIDEMGKLIDLDIKVELFRASITYKTVAMVPSNLAERLEAAGLHPTCGSCIFCEHYDDKRKNPRCQAQGFKVSDARRACELYDNGKEEDGGAAEGQTA